MFEDNTATQAAIEAVTSYLSGKSRGDVVPMSVLASIAFMEDTPAFRSGIVARARLRLLGTTGISTSGVHDTDHVRLLTVSEQVYDETEHRRRKATRQLSKIMRSQLAIPASDLAGDTHLASRVHANVEFAARQRRNLAREKRLLAALDTTGNIPKLKPVRATPKPAPNPFAGV